MEPGTPYEFTFHLYPTSNVFRKGHRIPFGYKQQQLAPLRRKPQHWRAFGFGASVSGSASNYLA